MNSKKRQNDRILKEELPRSVGAQYATGDQWRNNSGKNEGMEPKQKQYPVVYVTGDRSKIRCCKEQYYIGTWNVRSMNQDKLEVVKQEMARVNFDILGISELKWTAAAAAAISLQSCLTLCDPIDGSPPGSPAPGIFQARILEWVAFSFSKWTGMGEFNSDDHYIYYCGQESLRRNGVAILSKKESEMQYLDAISKTTE